MLNVIRALMRVVFSFSSFFEIGLLTVLIWFDFPLGMNEVILFLTLMMFSFLFLGRITYVWAWIVALCSMIWDRGDPWWIMIYCVLFSLPFGLVRLGVLYEDKILK